MLECQLNLSFSPSHGFEDLDPFVEIVRHMNFKDMFRFNLPSEVQFLDGHICDWFSFHKVIQFL